MTVRVDFNQNLIIKDEYNMCPFHTVVNVSIPFHKVLMFPFHSIM